MIKLTREQGEVLGSFNKWITSDSVTAKTYMIELLFEDSGLLAETFNTDELKLKATQAILDGEWEVEEPMSLDEFKEEYKLLKYEYNKMRLNGDITANRVYQEAVVKLVKDFLEEVE